MNLTMDLTINCTKAGLFMASIDYQEAKKEITKLFRTKDSGRKVIFWYDPPMNFNKKNFCR